MASLESESDSSTIIDEDKWLPPEFPKDGESSEEVVYVDNPPVYNPSHYNLVEAHSPPSAEIPHQISVLKIRIHGKYSTWNNIVVKS